MEKDVLQIQLITRSIESDTERLGTYEPNKGNNGFPEERCTGTECKINGIISIEVGQQTSIIEEYGKVTGEILKRLEKIFEEGDTNSS